MSRDWTQEELNIAFTPTLITALVDRLTFRAHILNMNNPSYRMDKG